MGVFAPPSWAYFAPLRSLNAAGHSRAKERGFPVDPALMIPQKTSMVANERPCESSGNALVAIATGARYLIPETPSESKGKALVAVATGARYREPETPCESRGRALVAIATGARHLIPEQPCQRSGVVDSNGRDR